MEIVKPVRIQRRRTAGYDMQAVSRTANGLECVSVTRPGRWGNPFDIRRFGKDLSLVVFKNTARGMWSPDPLKTESDEICDAMYAAHHAFLKRLNGHPLELMRSELSAKNLACYCKLPRPGEADLCHAAIILETLAGEEA